MSTHGISPSWTQKYIFGISNMFLLQCIVAEKWTEALWLHLTEFLIDVNTLIQNYDKFYQLTLSSGLKNYSENFRKDILQVFNSFCGNNRQCKMQEMKYYLHMLLKTDVGIFIKHLQLDQILKVPPYTEFVGVCAIEIFQRNKRMNILVPPAGRFLPTYQHWDIPKGQLYR